MIKVFDDRTVKSKLAIVSYGPQCNDPHSVKVTQSLKWIPIVAWIRPVTPSPLPSTDGITGEVAPKARWPTVTYIILTICPQSGGLWYGRLAQQIRSQVKISATFIMHLGSCRKMACLHEPSQHSAQVCYHWLCWKALKWLFQMLGKRHYTLKAPDNKY